MYIIQHLACAADAQILYSENSFSQGLDTGTPNPPTHTSQPPLLWKFFQCSHGRGTVATQASFIWVQTSQKVISYILPSYNEIRNAGKRHFCIILKAKDLGKSHDLTRLEQLRLHRILWSQIPERNL